MCDQSEVEYLPGNVVWVKLGPVWWPARVCKPEDVPSGGKELRKMPIAVVKFFQEDTFEYVKNLSMIYHYNCLKKNEFIKKGLASSLDTRLTQNKTSELGETSYQQILINADLSRSNQRNLPTSMRMFPEDVATAELLTGGNPDIVNDEKFRPEEKTSYSELFGGSSSTKKSTKRPKLVDKKESSSLPVTPRIITHPRFLRLSLGIASDYEVRERTQEKIYSDDDDDLGNDPPPIYRCTDCDFSTIRLNVIVLHNKWHTRNYTHQILRPGKSAKRAKRTPPAKSVKRTKKDEEVKKTPPVPEPVEEKKEEITITPPKKKQPPSSEVVEFQSKLLEDWAEFELDQEAEPQSKNAESKDDKPTELKSCFDFDESDDNVVLDMPTKFGEKLPRLSDDKKKRDLNTPKKLTRSESIDVQQTSDETEDLGDKLGVVSIPEKLVENSESVDVAVTTIESDSLVGVNTTNRSENIDSDIDMLEEEAKNINMDNNVDEIRFAEEPVENDACQQELPIFSDSGIDMIREEEIHSENTDVPDTPELENEKMFDENDVKENKKNHIIENEANDIAESNINTVEESYVNDIEENNVNTVEESDVNDTEESNVNTAEESNVNIAEESNVNTVEERDANDVEESDVNDVEANEISNIEKDKIIVEENEANDDEESEVSVVEESKANVVDESITNDAEEIEYNGDEEDTMNSVVESEMSNVEEDANIDNEVFTKQQSFENKLETVEEGMDIPNTFEENDMDYFSSRSIDASSPMIEEDRLAELEMRELEVQEMRKKVQELLEETVAPKLPDGPNKSSDFRTTDFDFDFTTDRSTGLDEFDDDDDFQSSVKDEIDKIIGEDCEDSRNTFVDSCLIDPRSEKERAELTELSAQKSGSIFEVNEQDVMDDSVLVADSQEEVAASSKNQIPKLISIQTSKGGTQLLRTSGNVLSYPMKLTRKLPTVNTWPVGQKKMVIIDTNDKKDDKPRMANMMVTGTSGIKPLPTNKGISIINKVNLSRSSIIMPGVRSNVVLNPKGPAGFKNVLKTVPGSVPITNARFTTARNLVTNATVQNIKIVSPQKSSEMAGTPLLMMKSGSSTGQPILLKTSGTSAQRSRPAILQRSKPIARVSGNHFLFNVQQRNVATTQLDSTTERYTTHEDILAKALENTDVLASESDTMLSGLGGTTQGQYIRTGGLYETSLTLNKPPIMSAYETTSTVPPPDFVDELLHKPNEQFQL